MIRRPLPPARETLASRTRRGRGPLPWRIQWILPVGRYLIHWDPMREYHIMQCPRCFEEIATYTAELLHRMRERGCQVPGSIPHDCTKGPNRDNTRDR